MQTILLLLALFGHVLLWMALVNRIGGLAIRTTWGKVVMFAALFVLTAIPAGYGWWLAHHDDDLLGRFFDGRWSGPTVPLLFGYVAGCWAMVAGRLAYALLHRRRHHIGTLVRRHHTLRHDLRRTAPEAARAAGSTPDAADADPAATTMAGEERAHHFLVHLPGNQVLKLDVTERSLEVPRLPAKLDGLSVAHLSDFHFTGLVGKAYFREVVRLCNQWQPDLVAVTGDLVDQSRFIDWIPDTLGGLRARYGVYYILGNHDLEVDVPRLRAALHEAGLIDVGGRWMELQIDGQPLILAGNELPWIVPAADLSTCPPPSDAGGPPRILLSHSPDQLDWARAHAVDLMLAGHTHGGQIRLPLIGPLLTMSQRGPRYASGIFFAPPTILHVTRGVSGEFPLRLNCAPEMTRLVLHAPGSEDAASGQ